MNLEKIFRDYDVAMANLLYEGNATGDLKEDLKMALKAKLITEDQYFMFLTYVLKNWEGEWKCRTDI